MASFDLSNQASAAIPTPSVGNTTVFIDTDKLLKSKDDTGAVTDYGAPGLAITSLTGEVTAAGPGAAASTVANSAVIAKVLTGLSPTTGSLSATDTILQAFNKLASKQNIGWFGTGVDGDVVVSLDTTLVRDMYYNNLTVNVGVTLFTNGYRVHVLGTLTNLGKIDRSGNNATGTASTPALVAGTVAGAGSGGAGGTAAGSAGGSSAIAVGSQGGAGGLGSGGAGGAGGTLTIPAATIGGTEVLQSARNATIAQTLAGTFLTGGSGGGGGGGDGTAGGAGGGGGGVMVINARNIFSSGFIKAIGGNGFQPLAGNRGGGGGGGGGCVVLVTEADASAISVDVSGGFGASGNGTGASGVNGALGRVVRVRV